MAAVIGQVLQAGQAAEARRADADARRSEAEARRFEAIMMQQQMMQALMLRMLGASAGDITAASSLTGQGVMATAQRGSAPSPQPDLVMHTVPDSPMQPVPITVYLNGEQFQCNSTAEADALISAHEQQQQHEHEHLEEQQQQQLEEQQQQHGRAQQCSEPEVAPPAREQRGRLGNGLRPAPRP